MKDLDKLNLEIADYYGYETQRIEEKELAR